MGKINVWILSNVNLNPWRILYNRTPNPITWPNSFFLGLSRGQIFSNVCFVEFNVRLCLPILNFDSKSQQCFRFVAHPCVPSIIRHKLTSQSKNETIWVDKNKQSSKHSVDVMDYLSRFHSNRKTCNEAHLLKLL